MLALNSRAIALNWPPFRPRSPPAGPPRRQRFRGPISSVKIDLPWRPRGRGSAAAAATYTVDAFTGYDYGNMRRVKVRTASTRAVPMAKVGRPPIASERLSIAVTLIAKGVLSDAEIGRRLRLSHTTIGRIRRAAVRFKNRLYASRDDAEGHPMVLEAGEMLHSEPVRCPGCRGRITITPCRLCALGVEKLPESRRFKVDQHVKQRELFLGGRL